MKAMTLDLAILTADADYEAALDTLLSSRTQALGIRSVSFKLIRALGHDPDVRLNAADYLEVLERFSRNNLGKPIRNCV